MLLLHVSNDTTFIEHLTAGTPHAYDLWSVIGSVNGFQVRRDILAEN